MAQMVTRVKALNDEKDILLAKDLAFEISVQVNSTGVTANAEGRKIIKAGTPVGGTTNALLNRKAVLSVTNDTTTGKNAQGVLRKDVDVTNGTANATLVIRGIVDVSKCSVVDEAKTALAPAIQFVNGGKA